MKLLLRIRFSGCRQFSTSKSLTSCSCIPLVPSQSKHLHLTFEQLKSILTHTRNIYMIIYFPWFKRIGIFFIPASIPGWIILTAGIVYAVYRFIEIEMEAFLLTCGCYAVFFIQRSSQRGSRNIPIYPGNLVARFRIFTGPPATL